MRVQVFSPGHEQALELQDEQSKRFEGVEDWQATARSLAERGGAFTITTDEGKVLAICGLFEVHEGYSLGWAFLAREIGVCMVVLTRIVKRYLDKKMESHRRIEMSVHFDHKAGHWWGSYLGFKYESTMEQAAPDGGDLVRYVRVRKVAK